MGKFIDIKDQRFGKLIALNAIHFEGRGKNVKWECLCDCGNRIITDSKSLRTKHTQSCGCIHKAQLGKRNRDTRKYWVNHSFFNVIDTEEKAYWLGFISADGCIRNSTLTVGLQEGDIEHLKKLRRALGDENRPISFEKNTKSASLLVSSKEICDALISLGCTERKSLTIKYCRTIPLDLQRHYWRGFVDGDGTVDIYGFGISLVGTNDVCNGFRDFILKYVNTRSKVHPNKNIFKFSVGGRNVISKLILLLYGRSSVYLERKYQRAIKMIQVSPGRKSPSFYRETILNKPVLQP